MTYEKRFVLLVGSPKGYGGTSGSIGNYILGKLPDKINIKDTFHIGKAIKDDETWNVMTKAVNDADTIILTFPLYWDSLPSHLIKAFERLYLVRQEQKQDKKQNFYVIINNGFPEPWHNEVGIAICRRFTKDMGMKWKGALNIGGGAAISGRPLVETGGMTYRLRETLNLAANAISKNHRVPKEVEERLLKPLYPAWINMIFGGFGWRSQARKKGAKTSLKARPYER